MSSDPGSRRRTRSSKATPVGYAVIPPTVTATSPVLARTRSNGTVAPTKFSGGADHSGCRCGGSSGTSGGGCSKKLMSGSIPAVDVFTVVFGGTLLFFVVFVLLLGLFSKRSARDYLDWKPTRSPEVEVQNEIDDVDQMIAAQNELRRKRGAPEITREEIEERWRES